MAAGALWNAAAAHGSSTAAYGSTSTAVPWVLDETNDWLAIALKQVLSASKRDIASHPSLPLSVQMTPVLLPRHMTNRYGVAWHIVSLVGAGMVLVVVASEVSI